MKIAHIVVDEEIQLGDNFDIELGHMIIESRVVGFMNDGVVIEADDKAVALLGISGVLLENVQKDTVSELESQLAKLKAQFDPNYEYSDDYSVWSRHKNLRNQIEDLEKRIAAAKSLTEAKYQGREVPLGKPMQGDVKKSKVYVRGPKGNVVKVNFGDKNMKIKKSNPKRRKSFRARHNCANPGPRWKARYWSCRAW
jgi:hypothetical protein